MDPVSTILEHIGIVTTYGTGCVAIAYIAFSFFSKKWLETQFSKKLEAYKHAQQKEMEQLRFNINTLFSRITKIHEKEIEVLPEAWRLLIDTLIILRKLVGLLQSYPDVANFSTTELDEYLANSSFSESEKSNLRTNPDKNRYIQQLIFKYDYIRTQTAFFAFHNYIEHNRIFLSAELKDDFDKIDDLMWSALSNRKTGNQINDHNLWRDAFKILQDEVAPIQRKIEALVQGRLHYPLD